MLASYLIWQICNANVKKWKICFQNVTNHNLQLALQRTAANNNNNVFYFTIDVKHAVRIIHSTRVTILTFPELVFAAQLPSLGQFHMLLPTRAKNISYTFNSLARTRQKGIHLMMTLFLTFLAFSSILTVILPVPGPISKTTSVDLRAACNVQLETN